MDKGWSDFCTKYEASDTNERMVLYDNLTGGQKETFAVVWPEYLGIDDGWMEFCLQYEKESKKHRKTLLESISEDQKESFLRIWPEFLKMPKEPVGKVKARRLGKRVALVVVIVSIIFIAYEIQSSKFEIYDTVIVWNAGSGLSALGGKVRNDSSRLVRGYVEIEILDKNKDVIGMFEAPVADLGFIEPGQAGDFKYFLNTSSLEGVKGFNATFKEY